MTPEQLKDLTAWMRTQGVAQFAAGENTFSVVFAPRAIEIPGRKAPAPASNQFTEELAGGDFLGLAPQGGDPIYDPDV